jgi:predicted helicase
MREELLKTFDQIYLLNLHGNALMGETAPDGGPDENVFDIRQGVAIMLAVKRPQTSEVSETSEVYYADLWGRREGKYRYLLENDVNITKWRKLKPVAPHFFFVPKDLDLWDEYKRGWSASEIFPLHSTGFATHRDRFVLGFSRTSLKKRIARFRDLTYSDDEVREQFGLKDTRDWHLSSARQSLHGDVDWQKYFVQCHYRPFDLRWIFYSSHIVEYPRFEVMRHLQRQNISIVTSRIVKGEEPKHVFVSADPVEKIFLSSKTSNNAFVFPLYLYTTPEDTEGTLFATQEVTREPNLSQPFIAAVKEKLALNFVPDGKGDLQSTFGPEDIFYYAYAVFHSPTYRERYAEFLKIDFPRLPLTSDRALFRVLAEKGEALAALHLMKSPALEPGRFITQFPKGGSNEVASRHPRYVAPGEQEPGTGEPLERGRVYINRTQYFEGIAPEVWAFQVGGYQVLHKWLKDRKGRTLSVEDVFHYQKIVVALGETMRLMTEIDEAIPDWPMQ